MPITRIDSLGVTVKGSMFGGEIDAGIVGGILRLDADYNIIGVFDDTTPVHQRVFYLGLQGGFSMAGMAGFTIRVGLSELGPLSAFINVEIPGGILLEPITGLTINDFSAGVEFFKTLPSIEDPFALRIERLPAADRADRRRVAERPPAARSRCRPRRSAVNPALNGFTAAFTAPMTITGGAKIYSIYTSQNVFNGEVIVKISTDGKFLIVGKLNFAADNLSISGRLYADLSKIASGSATVLFLADVPDQVRILTIYGKLKMGFKNASGEDVMFDVLDVPATQPGSTKPTATIMNPASAGGSVAITRTSNYVDVMFTAPTGGSLDYSTIMHDADQDLDLRAGHAGHVQLGHADGRRDRAPTASCATCRCWSSATPSCVDGEVIIRRSEVAHGREQRGHAARRDPQDEHDLLPLRPRQPGVDGRRRHRLDHRRRVQGARRHGQRRRSTFTFGVDGATARLSDPGAGGTIDVNVLNQRNWIDVAYAAPTSGGLGIDVGSIIDLAPEFVLAGAGLGTLALDGSRAPTLVSGTTYRYWLTGVRGTGAITLTYLPNTWAFNSTAVDGTTATAQIALTDGVPSTIVITLPTATGLTLDPTSVDLSAFASTISSSAAGWTIVFDASRAPILRNDGQWELPVLITPPTGAPSTATTTATVTFAQGGLAYTGQPATGTQADGTAIDVSTGILTNRTFIDVQFRPAPGDDAAGRPRSTATSSRSPASAAAASRSAAASARR